jgi:membrane fusion protein, multidrug efflux system
VRSRFGGLKVEQIGATDRLVPSREPRRIKKAKWTLRVLIGAAAVGAFLYLLPDVLYFFSHESTDDAYVTGTIVPVSSEVKGKVTRVFITDNQKVKEGDPLFEIQTDDYSARAEESGKALATLMAEEKQVEALLAEQRQTVAKARADLDSNKAQEAYALKEKVRYAELLRAKDVPQSQYDQIASKWEVAQALTKAAEATVSKEEASIQSLEAQLKTQKFKIEQARASLALVEIDLRRTLIKAPMAGQIAQKNVDPGKYVQPGQPVLSLVDVKSTWIVANFKETQVKKMKLGQPVQIEVDAYPGVSFKGRIESFQPGTGGVFALLPPENATGNFVKVVQRVPVKIVFEGEPDPAHPLWPGLSVTPHVDTTAEQR